MRKKVETGNSFSLVERATARFYDRWMGDRGLYGALGRLIFDVSGDLYARPFIRAAGLSAADRVLEIGCGPAMILVKTCELIAPAQLYLGVDISPLMVQRARHNLQRSKLADRIQVLVAGVNLPVAAATVDVVLLSHLVKYLTDEQLAVCWRECHRVLRRGGRLVFWEFAPLELPLLNRLVTKGAGAVRLRSVAELQSGLARAGFTDFRPFAVETPWLGWSNLALAALKSAED